MTGIAAQMVGRRAVLCELSPAAAFIAYNYNTPVDVELFEREAKRILAEVEAECGWMYETRHTDGRVGRINYTVWSDVFLCPYCGEEIVFWDAAVDHDAGKVHKNFPCSGCGAEVTKRDLARATEWVYDSVLGHEIEQAYRVPVMIRYSVGGKNYEKVPNSDDVALIAKIEASEIPYWYPAYPMMFRDGKWGDQWREGAHSDITHSHHFYFKRSLWVQAAYVNAARRNPRFLILLTSVSVGLASKLTRYNMGKRGNSFRSGTLYVPSQIAEPDVIRVLRSKLRNIKQMSAGAQERFAVLTVQSSSDLRNIPNESVDYVFTDPPFGDNLVYAELNFLAESWLRVFTNERQEAIISPTQRKELEDYRQLMFACFSEAHRILKPGRWITVEFHNSKASVWNAIQESLSRAGFIVAQVVVLDKKQGSYNQVLAPGAVKNDLVINAYKPRAGFSQRFLSQAGQGLEAEFVRQHLAQLPVAANVERSKEMLYSKYLAYYVQHGYQVAYNSQQFYRTLPQWGFKELDGYWFADEAQANEYETRKAKRSRPRGKAARKQSVLFISDERSARQWLWNLMERPMTYDEIYTAFVKALQTPEDQLPEPMTMLEEGFVRTDGQWKRPDALTQAELEARRQARLLRQFEEYLKTGRAGQRLKEVRKEALVVGFTEAYRAGRFQDILTVGRRLPKRLLESSPDLFDFIDIAEAKVEG